MAHPSLSGKRLARERGFAYLGLLIAIALIGVMLSTVGVVWSTELRREKETQLLFAGDQIRAAIGRYYSEGRVYPASLEDLLEDKRHPEIHRHLRRIYYDPMTADTHWQLLIAPQGGIMGVASTSQAVPIKKANFRLADRLFENATCYCDWQFAYQPRLGGRIGATPIPRN